MKIKSEPSTLQGAGSLWHRIFFGAFFDYSSRLVRKSKYSAQIPALRGLWMSLKFSNIVWYQIMIRLWFVLPCYGFGVRL